MKEADDTWETVCERAYSGVPQYLTRDGVVYQIVITLPPHHISFAESTCSRAEGHYGRFQGALTAEEGAWLKDAVEEQRKIDKVRRRSFVDALLSCPRLDEGETLDISRDSADTGRAVEL